MNDCKKRTDRDTTTHLHRERAVGLVAAAAIVTLLAACSPPVHRSTESTSSPTTTQQTSASASCTPQPCGVSGGLVIALTNVDGTIVGDPTNQAYVNGGLQLTFVATNRSQTQQTLLTGYFHVTDSQGNVIGELDTHVAGPGPTHDCDYGSTGGVTLAPHGGSSPQLMCFPIVPARQAGTMTLTYDDGSNPPLPIHFTTDGSRPSTSPTTSTSSASGPTGGAVPSGHWDGTYQGLHVSFDVANGQVGNFHADGSWTCATGIAEMVAVVPGSFAVNGNTFTIDTTAPINGYKTQWKITGQFDSSGGASGTYTEESDVICALKGATWQAR